jgi:hypothetical protein
MEASEHRYPDELCSLIALMRGIFCRWCAGRTLSNRAVRAPVVEIPDILGQDFLQMVLIEDEHVVEAFGPDRSHPTLGNRVGPRRSKWRARLHNTEITNPPIEASCITVVAVVNEKAWRVAVPIAAFYDLLCRPTGGWVGRDLHVQNLSAGVMDHEKHVQRSKRDRLDAKEVARPDS